MLMVHPSKRRKLNILQSNFCNGNFVIINYDGTVLSGCFAKENRNAVTAKVLNLLNDYYCEFIIIYFILCSNTHKKKPQPKHTISQVFSSLICCPGSLESMMLKSVLKYFHHDGHGWQGSQKASSKSTVTVAHCQHLAEKGTET